MRFVNLALFSLLLPLVSNASFDRPLPQIKGSQVPQEKILEHVPIELPAAYQLFVLLENHFNSGLKDRASDPIVLEHFEIPLSALNIDEADYIKEIAPMLKSALIFERSGKKYVRWLLNPEDRKYHKELKNYLRQKNIEIKKEQHFIGYLTASRSVIVQDPISGAVFSFKGSTDRVGSLVKDKGFDVVSAKDARRMSDYLYKNNPEITAKNFDFAPEPLAFHLPEIDQALTFRVYPQMNQGKLVFPFTALFSDLPENFQEQPYWHKLKGVLRDLRLSISEFRKGIEALRNQVSYLMGRALAEGNFLYGVQPSQPHSQNKFAVTDNSIQSNNRIGERDLESWNILEPLVKALGGKELIDLHMENSLEGKVSVKGEEFEGLFGPLRLTRIPRWLQKEGGIQSKDDVTYKQRDFLESQYWPSTAIKGIGDRASEILGLPVEDIIEKTFVEGYSYTGISYKLIGNGSRQVRSKLREVTLKVLKERTLQHRCAGSF